MDFKNMMEQIISDPALVATFVPPLIERYMPLVDTAVNELFKAGSRLQEVYIASDYVKTSAKARKVKYDAYIEAGFTPEQAMSLLLTDVRQVATMAKGDLSHSAAAVTKVLSDA